MSRNGSGVYTTPNTFVAGATITAAGHNQNWSDLASEMTNSVAADGQTTMTGPLKASSGTAAAPSHSFGSDPDTGAYRIGSNNYGIAVGGTKIVDVSSTGASVTGDFEASGVVKQGGFSLLPVGLGPLPWSGTTAPTGWVLTGQTLSRTTYAALWAFAEAEIALGNTLYTNGNGTTTFTIASTGGKVLAGKEASASVLTSTHFGGDSTVLGATGGAESVALSLLQLPGGVTATGITNNAITVTGPSSGGVMSRSISGGGTSEAYQAGSTNFNNTNNVQMSGSNNITSNVTSSNTGAAGNGTGVASAHNNVQPTIIANFIIFAGV
jgi:microcystin-dependent protein